jgi:hypothetical protein
MSRPTKASSFLQNMKIGENAPAASNETAPAAAAPARKSAAASKPSGRAGLKHIGGYFDAETVERVAILRARLSLDNSELLKLAIDDLFSREKAKRAFAD